MWKGLLMQTAALGTRSPLRHLGAIGQGREDRMQAASVVISGAQDAPLLAESQWLTHLGKIPLGTC